MHIHMKEQARTRLTTTRGSINSHAAVEQRLRQIFGAALGLLVVNARCLKLVHLQPISVLCVCVAFVVRSFVRSFVGWSVVRSFVRSVGHVKP